MKTLPDGTYPGILRDLMTIGFPVVISTQVTIPDRRVVLDKYKKKFRKMQAAQKDSKGNLCVDVTAQVRWSPTRRLVADTLIVEQ